MTDTIELLKALDSGCHMAMNSIHQLQNYELRKALADTLEKYRKKHHQLQEEVASLLAEQGEEGKLPGIKGALLSDAVGTMCGACLGTSTITTFVESASGIAEGGRTGLTAIASGALFLLALFFSPLFLTIPSFATAPALVMVGFLMMQQVSKIEWDNILEAIPAFICIFAMAFMYSISEGICFGIISYTVLNVASGKAKQVTPLMYVLTVVFILKYILI